MFIVALLLQDMFLTFLTWLGLVLGRGDLIYFGKQVKY